MMKVEKIKRGLRRQQKGVDRPQVIENGRRAIWGGLFYSSATTVEIILLVVGKKLYLW